MKAAVYFFFFQAEDGIRDLTVTGVQTCALPISQKIAYLGWVAYANYQLNCIAILPEYDYKRRGKPWEACGDRKSTRLNSSHSQISYAVFCLKKKKKMITIFTSMHIYLNTTTRGS